MTDCTLKGHLQVFKTAIKAGYGCQNCSNEHPCIFYYPGRYRPSSIFTVDRRGLFGDLVLIGRDAFLELSQPNDRALLRLGRSHIFQVQDTAFGQSIW